MTRLERARVFPLRVGGRTVLMDRDSMRAAALCLVMGEGCVPAQGGTVTVSREGDKTVLALDTGAGRYEERTDGDGALALAAAIAGACA